MQFDRKTVGVVGENIATRHLQKKNFSILCRNYRKPWGEIDIIAKRGGVIHFIEVKSVSCETNKIKERIDSYWSPEDNIHSWKLQRLNKAILSYLGMIRASEDQKWQIDSMAIFLDLRKKVAKIRHIEDI